jgi:hypothetical protein
MTVHLLRGWAREAWFAFISLLYEENLLIFSLKCLKVVVPVTEAPVGIALTDSKPLLKLATPETRDGLAKVSRSLQWRYVENGRLTKLCLIIKLIKQNVRVTYGDNEDMEIPPCRQNRPRN